MSIFKKINNELTDNVTVTPKQKKSPLPRFQKKQKWQDTLHYCPRS